MAVKEDHSAMLRRHRAEAIAIPIDLAMGIGPG